VSDQASGDLRRASVDALLSAGQAIGYPLRQKGEEQSRIEYGGSVFDQLNSVMKLALEAGDQETFSRVEDAWYEIPRRMLARDDESLVQVGVELAERRQLLTFGLAMWAAHLCREPDKGSGQRPAEELRTLASRFGTAEDVFSTYERANADEEEQKGAPWSNWFLSELPPERFHYVPTSGELLFTALLLGLARIGAEAPDPLQPRDWFGWRAKEIASDLDLLEGEAELWGPILGQVLPAGEEGVLPAENASVDDWRQRVVTMRRLIRRGRETASMLEHEHEREQPLDPARVEELRSSLIEELKSHRYLRDVFVDLDALEIRDAPPRGFEPRIFRSWIPRAFLVPDSKVLGIDMAGRDLARVTLSEEVDQMIGALPRGGPPDAPAEAELRQRVEDEVEALVGSGYKPSLLLLPMSWRLRESLGLDAFAASDGLQGEVAGLPVLEIPQLDDEFLWVADLDAAVSLIEWRSYRDSGVVLELTEFDQERARRFLVEHPEAAGERTQEEAELWLQDHVMFTQRPCWTVEADDPEAARVVRLPESLVLRG
jgi:hypothetical protein